MNGPPNKADERGREGFLASLGSLLAGYRRGRLLNAHSMNKPSVGRVVLAQRVLVAQLLASMLFVLFFAMWKDVQWFNASLTIFLLGVPVAWLLFVAWALVHCLRNESLRRTQRVGWCAAIVLANIGGAWFYAARHANGTP